MLFVTDRVLLYGTGTPTNRPVASENTIGRFGMLQGMMRNAVVRMRRLTSRGFEIINRVTTCPMGRREGRKDATWTLESLNLRDAGTRDGCGRVLTNGG